MKMEYSQLEIDSTNLNMDLNLLEMDSSWNFATWRWAIGDKNPSTGG